MTGQGIQELKDCLWQELNKEENKITAITHRNLDINHRVREEDEFELDETDENDYEEYDWEE